MSDGPEWYNVSMLLDANLDAGRGDKVAIYSGAECITYAELVARVCAMGRALAALGVCREQRILLVLDDTPAFPIAFFGAIRLGAVPVPINPLYKSADYRYFLEDTGAGVIVTERTYLPKVREALAGHTTPVSVIVTEMSAPGDVDASAAPDARTYAFADLLAAHTGALHPANTHRDDVAFWLYSGGSTGRPKAIVHLQHDIPYTWDTYGQQIMRVTDADVIFGRVLFHAYGLGNALSFAFAAGASTILRPGRPTPDSIASTIERFRPTVLCLVPTLYNAILNDPGTARADLTSLRLCTSAAEPLSPDIWRRWKERCGVPIFDGIGSTEMLHIFCSNTADACRPGSSGKAVPGYELRLLDEDGQPVASGEVGDLWVKGDSALAFYWRQHARTKSIICGDWVATGDRYRIDVDGFYWYEGRADDMIKAAGEWVSPIEIENAITAHPAVSEGAVVGISIDGIMRIKASIILIAGQQSSSELTWELQEWCKARLQRYQYPHIIEIVETLPKTVTGKIQRFKLRDIEP